MPTSATPNSGPTPPRTRSASTGRCASTTCAAPTTPLMRRNGGPRLAGPSSAPTPPPLSPGARAVARRLAEVLCPPGMREQHRTGPVLAELELMLGALAPAARTALIAAVLTLDQGARLYPRARGRRFTRLDDQCAEAYLQALLARG